MFRVRFVSWMVCLAMLVVLLCAGFVFRSKSPPEFLTVLPLRRDLAGVYGFTNMPGDYSARGDGKLVLHLDGELTGTGSELALCEGLEKTVVQTIVPAIRHSGKWEVAGDAILLTWVVDENRQQTSGAFLRVKRERDGFVLCPDIGFDFCVAPLCREQ